MKTKIQNLDSSQLEKTAESLSMMYITLPNKTVWLCKLCSRLKKKLIPLLAFGIPK